MIDFTKEQLDRYEKDGTMLVRRKKKAKTPEKKAVVKAAPPPKPVAPAPVAVKDNSTADLVKQLAAAMEKMGERKPYPYRFNIHRDKRGFMQSVTATPMMQEGT